LLQDCFFCLFGQLIQKNNKHSYKYIVPQSDQYLDFIVSLQLAENATWCTDTGTVVCTQQIMENRWREGCPGHSVHWVYTGLACGFSSQM